jgi:putative membrane protein
MKSLPLLAIFSIAICLLSSCSSSRNSSAGAKPKKSGITGVRPNVKTPSIGVINASGDALTPGINSANRNGAGSEENATAIANNAITKANTAVRRPQLKLDTITGQDFISRISAIDKREVKMSQLALEKSANQKIKDYAAMTIKSHQQLQNDLDKLSANAAAKGAELIITSLQFIQAPAGRVKSSAGEDKGDFDTGYIQTTIEDYQAFIRMLEGGSRSKDASISAFATKYLPVLRQHLSAAQDLTRK